MTARLEVIVGPMFSGKTERLIAELHRVGYARKRTRILKPSSDSRTNGSIASRAVMPEGTTRVTKELSAIAIGSEDALVEQFARQDYDVLAIDEAQFMGMYLVPRLRTLLRERRDSDLRIIVAGLDLNFAEEPFGPIPGLLAIANSIEKLTAVCMQCGADNAHLTQRLIAGDASLDVGDIEKYEARCRACYEPPTV